MKTEGCSPKDLNTLVARALQSSALRQSYSEREGAILIFQKLMSKLERTKNL